MKFNESVENYLKAAFDIQQRENKVSTTSLARKLGVKPASVTGMLKKLAKLKLITYERYQGVSLTAGGEKIALEVIRHHRLIERFLAEALDVPWDKVHDEAEKWEHILSEDMEERIDKFLGSPSIDPHGAPIPAKNGRISPSATQKLAALSAGQSATIAEVSDHDGDLLRYLGKIGLYPNTRIQIIDVEPYGGHLRILINDSHHYLGLNVARHISVKDIKPIVK